MTYGVNDNRRVQCQRSEHHGFHPANEDCPYCEPYLTFEWQWEPPPEQLSLYDSADWLRRKLGLIP